MLSKKNLAALTTGSVVLGILLAAAGTVFAAPGPGGPGAHPVTVGTVSAINGTTLTVVSKVRPLPLPSQSSGLSTSTTYTIDATNASVIKDGKPSVFSAISVGNRVAVWGTVNGSTITATSIRDGMSHRMKGWKRLARDFHGNGEPIVGGNVVTVNGTTLTITNKSDITYTVDAASSTVEKMGGAKIPLSTIVVGDRVIVQGAVNGTSVTASSILDQGIAMAVHTEHPMKGTSKISDHSVGFLTHLFGF